MHTQLQPGTILDGRYRIDAVLGQGGFGITYAAENTRAGLKVAIKELFWRGHCLRPDPLSPEIALADAADAPIFEEQKQRFLREARTIRDFSGQAGVVGIRDYFEANNTGYIVMEFVQGETLAARSAAGPMPCEELLRQFLPIIDTLGAIHQAGIIHRDISPDNIMMQSDGSLKLIDFGAARHYQGSDGGFTAISRDSYSPCEQYDKNGRQGPWTDVYALCATLYACVCGAPPQGAIQRMFLDELKTPSQLGVDILPAYETIIMKGLQLRPEKRWQTMDELAKAIRAALPEEKKPSTRHRALVIGLLAGLLCVALALGIWGWRRYDATHRFRGIETEQIRFEATKDTTAAEFAAAPEELRKRLEAFVGRDNYLLTVDGDSMVLTLPLSAFDDREIWDVIKEHFSKLVPEKGTNIRYEDKANWEDPSKSMTAGQNQVLPEALEGATVMLRYDWDDSLTRGQRANLIVDFKTRVDALGVPYAFGSAYGNDDSIMLRIGLDRIGDPILNTIGGYPSQYELTAFPNTSLGWVPGFSSSTMEFTEEEGVPTGLRFSDQSDYYLENLKDYTREMLKCGLDKIYLVDKEHNPIACVAISSPVTDGVLEFRDFCLKDIPSIEPDNLWLLGYYDTLVNETKLPDICSLSRVQYVDADGHVPLNDTEIDYGVVYEAQDTCQALRERLQSLEEKHGFTLQEGESFWLLLDLPLDDTLPGNIAEKLPALLADIADGQQVFPKKIFIVASEEKSDEQFIYLRNRFVISTSYDSGKKRFINECSEHVWGDAVEPWRESIESWWNAFDPGPYGIEKSEF